MEIPPILLTVVHFLFFSAESQILNRLEAGRLGNFEGSEILASISLSMIHCSNKRETKAIKHSKSTLQRTDELDIAAIRTLLRFVACRRFITTN